MEERKIRELYQTAKEWTLEAGERLKQSLQETIQVEYKTSASDLVTQKDKEIEQFFVERINQTYPGHFILGEEGISNSLQTGIKKGVVWIIDPIDGTTNFVHQKKNFAISVGIYIDGKPIIGLINNPIENELFHANINNGAYLNEEKLEPLKGCSIEEAVISFNHIWLTTNEKVDFQKVQELVRDVRGVRSVGSAALEIANVASGRFDGYLDFRLSPWDIAAGIVILKELGGNCITMEGKEIDVFAPSSTFFAKPELTAKVIDYLM